MATHTYLCYQKVLKLVDIPVYLSWQFDAVNDRVNQMVVL